MNVPNFSRRDLIKLCGFAALATPALGQSANNRVRLGIIGCGWRAKDLAKLFSKINDVEIVALSDPHPAQMDSVSTLLAGKSKELVKFQDYRKLLDQSDIDAVVIASPNHWHTLHAIHAMQAGKDVYMEKPVTHDIWEGAQLLAAEAKYGRIVAAGHQGRSDPGIKSGISYVQEGNLGKILRIHVCCFRERDSIGKRAEPLVPPAGMDYNLWLGPAAELPLYRENLHYDWHWVWNTGNGDTGNQAPHEIDTACQLLGDLGLPESLRSFGGRFGWNDAGETPNLQSSFYEIGGVPLVLEVNDLKITPTRNTVASRDGIRVGIVAHCEGGQLRGGLSGMYAVGPDGKKPIMKFSSDGGAMHQENFINAVRSRKKESIASRLTTAVQAATIAHLSNVSYRTGASVDAAKIQETFPQEAALAEILADQSKQLADWGISNPSYTLGQKIDIEPGSRKVVTPELDAELIRRTCRPEFVIPELA